MQFLALLVLHICGGITGLVSGATAMFLRKGSRRHALAGNVFVIAMLFMAASGSYLGFVKHEMGNVFGGVLTLYMVATAWRTGRRKDTEGKPDIFDWCGFLFALAIGAFSVTYGIEKATGRIVPHDGVPGGMNIFMGSVALLAAAGDIRMILRGIAGTQRLMRHLWRMCFALFIATGSFFIGQQKVFPAFVRGTALLYVLGILPLPLLIFWLLRVRFTNAYNAYKRKPVADHTTEKDLAFASHPSKT